MKPANLYIKETITEMPKKLNYVVNDKTSRFNTRGRIRQFFLPRIVIAKFFP